MMPPHEAVSGTSPTCVLASGARQLSVAVTSSGLATGMFSAHATVVAEGHDVIAGSSSSLNVTSVEHVAEAPSGSVSVNVSVRVAPHGSRPDANSTAAVSGLPARTVPVAGVTRRSGPVQAKVKTSPSGSV